MAKRKTPENADTPTGSEQAKQDTEAKEPAGAEQTEVTKDARKWSMFCHLAGLAGYVMPVIGNVVAPLIIWQIKKDEYRFVDEQGKEAVNFQISMSLYVLAGSILCLITCIGAVLIPFIGIAVGIVDLVFLLIAAVKANNGQHYRYPLSIRLIK